MAVYVPLHSSPLQYMDDAGDPLASGTLEFYEAGTSTPTNLFSDNVGTSIGSSITLNSEGYPESGGNVITLFRDTSVNLKIIAKSSGAATIWTADGLNTALAVLATSANGEGASLIGIEDSAGNFSATTVEGALAETLSNLASTSTNLGASLVGVEDSGGNFTGTDVEAVLAEMQAQFSDSDSFTATLTGFSSNPTPTINYRVVGSTVHLWCDANSLGTSNSSGMSMTGAPAALYPSTSRQAVQVVRDNSAGVVARMSMSSTGTILFDLSPFSGGGFTASGSKGIFAGWQFVYAL